MRFAAFSRIAACIVGIICSFAPMTSEAANCKCRKNPGPGGGVECARDQIATCDATSGEWHCTCDSVQPGKTKADYQAQMFSKVFHTKVDPDDLSSPQYQKYVSSFRKSAGDEGTFTFDKEAGASRGRQVTVGVPEWLEEVLGGKGGVSIGPGASFQNCPNGICIGGENSGTATVNNFAPPPRTLTPEQVANLASFLRQNGSFRVVIFHAEHNFEAQNYADKLAEAIKSAGWTAVMDRSMEEVKQGEGLLIIVRDLKNPPPGSVILQNGLKQIGLYADGVAGPYIRDNEIWLYIGVQSETKQP